MNNNELCAKFITWYFNDFCQSELFLRMNSLAENSPWHRETSIGIHTNMVVANYIGMVEHEWWLRDELVGALAAAFHDVGKPVAAEKNGIQFKPERGEYLSFTNHELISARLWEDYASKNWKKLVNLFDLTPYDIYTIGWMIEYHTSAWKIKNKEKRRYLMLTSMLASEPRIFINLLEADAYGRISDGATQKRESLKDWIRNFYDELPREIPDDPDEDQSILIIPIGPSGCGKSTYRTTLDSTYECFSLDDLRLNWYSNDYAEAFRLSCEDKEFNKKSQNTFLQLIKTGTNVYVDNTNTSKKRRAWYINEARRKGYHIKAILFPCSVETVVSRQNTRPDKNVPEEAVIRQYNGLQLPQYGEFDSIDVVGDNLYS